MKIKKGKPRDIHLLHSVAHDPPTYHNTHKVMHIMCHTLYDILYVAKSPYRTHTTHKKIKKLYNKFIKLHTYYQFR